MKKSVGILFIAGFLCFGYFTYGLFANGEIQAKDLSDTFNIFKQLPGAQNKTETDAPVINSEKQSVKHFNKAQAEQLSTKPDSTAAIFDISKTSIPDLSSLFPNISMETLPIFLDVASAFLELMKEDPMIREDLSKIMYALGHCLTVPKAPDGHNAWDTREMTDWERILYCTEDILHPGNKAKFKPLVLRMMKASKALQGSDFLYGAQYSMGNLYRYRNPTTNKIMDLDEIDYALYRVMFQLNQNFKPRDEDAIKMSEMRSVLLALDAAESMTAPIKGAPAKLAFSLMKLDQAGPDIKTKTDALEFMAGLMGKSMYYYPKSYHNSFQIDKNGYRLYPDPLKGVDWFFYNQQLSLAGILPLRGIDGILYLMKNFTVADLVIGVMTENLNALYTVSGGTGQEHTTGQRHRLMTIAAPVLNQFYDQGYLPQVIEVFSSLNEIPLSSYKSSAWNRNKGTLYQENLGTAMEVVEGPYGYGALYYLMRGASDARYNNDADFLDPCLDLSVRVLYKLSRTPYGNSDLLRGMCDELNKINLDALVKNNEDVGDILYGENGVIDIMYRLLHENHEQFVQIGEGLGKVMLSAANQNDPEENLFYTCDIINLLQGSVFPALSLAMRENNAVVTSIAGNIKKMVFSDTPGPYTSQNKTP